MNFTLKLVKLKPALLFELYTSAKLSTILSLSFRALAYKNLLINRPVKCFT